MEPTATGSKDRYTVTEADNPTPSATYRPLGLIANPFVPRTMREGEPLISTLEIHSQANVLLAHIEAVRDADRPKTIWVDKNGEIHNYYFVGAQSTSEEALIRDDSLNVLPVYVQLFMMRSGRVRAAMNTLAERIATRSFDRTLAAWVREIIASPDTELPESSLMGPEAWDAFVTAFEADPIAELTARFGTCELERVVILKQPTDTREASLVEEPDEDDDTPEDDAITEQMPSLSEAVLAPTGGEERDEDTVNVALSDPVVEYIIAYTKAHLSPVIARGLRGYLERGLAQMMTELKVTKAPRKTFKALTQLAALRFDKIVLIYDGFESWRMLAEESRHAAVSALTELRFIMGGRGVMVFLVAPGQADELEDQFGGGDRIEWDFAGLTTPRPDPDALDIELAQRWVDLATVPESPRLDLGAEPIKVLQDAADGDMNRYIALAGAAIESAAGRGASAVEQVDIDAAIAREAEA